MSEARLPAFQAARIYSHGRRVSTICCKPGAHSSGWGPGGGHDAAGLDRLQAKLLGPFEQLGAARAWVHPKLLDPVGGNGAEQLNSHRRGHVERRPVDRLRDIGDGLVRRYSFDDGFFRIDGIHGPPLRLVGAHGPVAVLVSIVRGPDDGDGRHDKVLSI
jgi:hypothetical protein